MHGKKYGNENLCYQYPE